MTATTDPVEGMARAVRVSDNRRESACCGQCRDKTRQARAAWEFALVAMHDIDPALLRLAFGDFRGAMISWQAAVRAFTREHGLEVPDAG